MASCALLNVCCSLHKCFSFGYIEDPPVIGFDNAQIKIFAEEAEDQFNLDLAAKYRLVC